MKKLLARLGKYLYLKYSPLDLRPLVLEQMGMRRDFVDIESLPAKQRLEFLKKCYEYYNDTDGLMLIFSNYIEQQLYEMAIYQPGQKGDVVQKVAITTIGAIKDYLQNKAILYLAETQPEENYDKYQVT